MSEPAKLRRAPRDDIEVVTYEDPNSIYGQARREEAEREQKQRDIEQDARNRLLHDGLSFEEFNRRREAMRFLVSDPTVPLDEASQTDYEKRRQRETAPAHRFMRVGELSLDEYAEARDKLRGRR